MGRTYTGAVSARSSLRFVMMRDDGTVRLMLQGRLALLSSMCNLVFDGDEQISNTLYLNEVGESFSASLIALSQDAGVRMVVEDLICWMAFGSCDVPRTN